MAMLHEKVGMRIGLTLTDDTIPSKTQVNDFLREGLHRVTDLLDAGDLWPLTRSKLMSYPNGGIGLADLEDADTHTEGYASIQSIYRLNKASGEYIRCVEIEPNNYHKAASDEGSMLYATEDHPVFTYRSGRLVVLPTPVNSVTNSGDAVEVNYLSSVIADSDLEKIPGVSPHVESVIINYASSQAASVLAAYYAQDDDPMAEKIAMLSGAQMTAFQTGMTTLREKKKMRGGIS